MFVPLFVLSSFIPVLPLYKGAVEPILMMVLPIWAIYASVFVMPEWLLFSCPVIVTHTSLSYLIARRLAASRRDPISFSLISLISSVTVMSIGVALIVSYAADGFCVFFLACMLTIVVANYMNKVAIVGIPVPKMNRPILISSTAICTMMALFGMPVLLARITG